MIIKSKSHTYRPDIFRYLLEYIHSDKGRATVEKNNSFFSNLYGNSIDEIIEAFEANDRFRKPSNTVALHHIILSFSPKDSDKLTDEMLYDLAQKFIELRGGDKSLVYGRVHNSNHKHIHLLFSGNQVESEKSMRISKQQYLDIRKEMQRYQAEKYPELSNSIIEFGNRKSQEKVRGLSEGEKKMQERGIKLHKSTCIEHIKALLNQCRNTAEFYDLLVKKGFTLYKHDGEIKGVISPEGRKYQFGTLGYSSTNIEALDIHHLQDFSAKHRGLEHER